VTKRVETGARLPVVFGLCRTEAAAAIGISGPTFDTLVQKGMMPRPHVIGTRKVWDVDELRAAFKALPREQEEEIDTWADVA
jgi:predicted DNA-binding transcriptional regulator AlpA